MAKSDYRRLTPDTLPEGDQVSLHTSAANIHQSSSLPLKKTHLLFGKVLIETQSPVQKELPETRLDLILKGTFTHENSEKASALIAETNKSTDRFFVGDKIPGGAELVAVRKGEVTLRRNGQDELLKLPFFKIDERVAQKVTRRSVGSLTKATSLLNTGNPPIDTEATNNSQQLKDRLAKLRNKQPSNKSINQPTNQLNNH